MESDADNQESQKRIHIHTYTYTLIHMHTNIHLKQNILDFLGMTENWFVFFTEVRGFSDFEC